MDIFQLLRDELKVPSQRSSPCTFAIVVVGWIGNDGKTFTL